MTSDIHANTITTISVKLPILVEQKNKRRNILTNKSSKSLKIIKANDKGEKRKFPKYNVVKFFNEHVSIMFL